MNLTFKAGLILTGVFMVFISASYVKGCYDGEKRSDAKWEQAIAQAKPDTTVEQKEPKLPPVIKTKVKVIKDTIRVHDTTYVEIPIAQVAFTDSLSRDLANPGETPLPFKFKASHLVTFFGTDSADVQTSYDELSIPIRTITKSVLVPQSWSDSIEAFLMGTGIGILVFWLITTVF